MATTHVSDRAAALDRYSQTAAVQSFLATVLEEADLATFGYVSQDTPERLAEAGDLLNALWPIEEIGDEDRRDRSAEFLAADARADVLTALLLTQVADLADELRGRARTMMGVAQRSLVIATEKAA